MSVYCVLNLQCVHVKGVKLHTINYRSIIILYGYGNGRTIEFAVAVGSILIITVVGGGHFSQ